MDDAVARWCVQLDVAQQLVEVRGISRIQLHLVLANAAIGRARHHHGTPVTQGAQPPDNRLSRSMRCRKDEPVARRCFRPGSLGWHCFGYPVDDVAQRVYGAIQVALHRILAHAANRESLDVGDDLTIVVQ